MSILRDFVGWLLDYGGCPRCGRTWWGTKLTDAHHVNVCHGLDARSVCARCWVEITSEQRLMVVREAIGAHIANGHYGGDCPHSTVDEAIACLAVRQVPPICCFRPSYGPDSWSAGTSGLYWTDGATGPAEPIGPVGRTGPAQ